MFQDTPGKRKMAKDIDKIFKRCMRKTQERRGTGLTEGFEIEEDTSLRRLLSRVSTTEEHNMRLDGEVAEANNLWKKRKNGNGGESYFSMLATYTQVENGL